MTERAAYLAEETTWLMSYGMHPLNIAAALNVKPRALYEIGRLNGLTRIQEQFAPHSFGVSSWV